MNRHQHGIRSRGCIWERAAVFRVKLIDRRANWPWMSSDTQMLYSRQHKLHGPLHPPLFSLISKKRRYWAKKKKTTPSWINDQFKKTNPLLGYISKHTQSSGCLVFSPQKTFSLGFLFFPLLSRSARLTSPRCSRARSLLQGAAKTGVALGNIS